MSPRLRAIIPGRMARVTWISPVTLVATIWSQCSRRALVRRVEAEGEPRVVHEDVHLPPALRQAVRQSCHGGRVRHVERQRQDGRSELGGELRETRLSSTGPDHAIPVTDEPLEDGATEAGGCARDEGRLGGGVLHG